MRNTPSRRVPADSFSIVQADAITHKIGYPTVPNTEDPLSLQRYYSLNLPVSQDDYFGNVLRSRLADQRRMWVQVGRQMDKGMWDMIPSEVNAYYSREFALFPFQLEQIEEDQS